MQRSPIKKTEMTHSASDTDIPNIFSKESEKQSKRISAKRLRMADDDGLGHWSIFKDEIKELIDAMVDKQNTRLDKLEKNILVIKNQNDAITNSNNDIKQSMDYVSEQIKDLQNKISNLEGEKNTMTKQMDMIDVRIDNLERINKKSSIEIRNVPRRPKEGKKELFNMIQKLYSVIDSQDMTDAYQLRDVYRLPSKPDSTTSTIVAEFSNTLAKDNFIQKVKKYSKNKYEQLNSKHLGINDPKTFIYISEHLTVKATRLFYLARDVAKTQGFDFCWTSNGRVFLRKKENAPHILVKDEETLVSIKKNSGQPE
ncbi:Zinc finger DNA binding protein [Operophtera brumata]|uniref:Zinc finger DNA binding protein n=1 Tax=Operophtera brumata TaxID=104452 RepID=A0A0L7LVW8_OPEBR|nr:Zinc finger DNA binding protein [Operophtera brumata]